MKKVILALAVVFSVALVSCSSKEAANTDSVAADTTPATEEVAEDTNAAADSATEVAPATEEVKADSAEAK
ncbi:MAG: hypothetical protein K2M31_06110 [Muribaculaceae bacterium]|nr:hypothetical protein [Muribaculaceae bacterium]